MPLAFGGILSFRVGLIALVAIAWYVGAPCGQGLRQLRTGLIPKTTTIPTPGTAPGREVAEQDV